MWLLTFTHIYSNFHSAKIMSTGSAAKPHTATENLDFFKTSAVPTTLGLQLLPSEPLLHGCSTTFLWKSNECRLQTRSNVLHNAGHNVNAL